MLSRTLSTSAFKAENKYKKYCLSDFHFSIEPNVYSILFEEHGWNESYKKVSLYSVNLGKSDSITNILLLFTTEKRFLIANVKGRIK